MENWEQNKQNNLEHLHKLANELDVLQKTENDGRGVSCVQSVISYLRQGKLDEAKRLCNWDHDKIANYPKLVTYIKNNLFEPGEDHPWSVLERLQKDK